VALELVLVLVAEVAEVVTPMVVIMQVVAVVVLEVP
jgi:hypothetical protein